MRPEELMLGDYVTFKDSLENGTILKIKIIALGENETLVQIDGDDACDITAIDDEIVGIPITPEILEKNGLKPFEIDRLRDKHSSAKWWAKGGSFFVKQYNFKHNDFKPTYSIGTHPNSLIVGLKYVHELQHALRLCGIEKEITI